MTCSRTDPRNRALSCRSTTLKASALTKCNATTAMASNSRPAPAAMPIAADSHTAAAVVSPCTAPRRVMMIPAPKKPMPETIWAATRDGSSSIVCADRTSPNPYLLINMINADEVPTMVLGPQSRDLALDGAFQAGECREPERGEKLDEMSAALRSAALQRARKPDLHIRQT
jgi:hypothetical protein